MDLRERQSSEIVKAIAGGLADIGIISDAVDSGDLMLRPFAIDRLVVVMARTHPLAGTKRIALTDIVDQAHVGLAAGRCRTMWSSRPKMSDTS